MFKSQLWTLTFSSWQNELIPEKPTGSAAWIAARQRFWALHEKQSTNGLIKLNNFSRSFR